jgi:hypothetical protein
MAENTPIWTPLSSGKPETRTLTLLPSCDEHSIIKCVLDIVSLDEHPQYEAISYAWGNLGHLAPVKVGERIWNIPLNLEACLRQFRNQTKSRTLWVDALCVSQTDIDEKGRQVALMDRIFKQAEVVRIWLGPATSSSGRAMNLLRCLGSLSEARNPLKINNRTVIKSDVEALSALLSRLYWKRAWTLQEMALSKTATFHCGGISIDINDFPSSVATVHAALVSLASFYERPDPEGARISDTLHSISAILMMRQSGLIGAPDFQAYAHAELCYNHMVTDDRDNIYAFLGMLDHRLARRIIPDYTKTLMEICREFVFLSIRDTGGNTLILHFAVNLPSCNVSETNWPSWVPYYAAKENLVTPFCEQFQTCMYIPSKAALIPDGYLKLLGFHFDHIISMLTIREECSPVSRVAQAQHREWRSLFGLLSGTFGSKGLVEAVVNLIWKPPSDDAGGCSIPYIGGGTLEEAYWYTLTAGCCVDLDTWDLRRQRAGDSKAYQSWLEESLTVWGSAKVSKEADEYRGAIVGETRTLFITHHGYIGISHGHKTPAVGDEIVLIAGSATPFICRRERQATPRQHTFALREECYVHGIMDGEVNQAADWQDIYLV